MLGFLENSFLFSSVSDSELNKLASTKPSCHTSCHGFSDAWCQLKLDLVISDIVHGQSGCTIFTRSDPFPREAAIGHSLCLGSAGTAEQLYSLKQPA
jgi:hypothetical protein